MTILFRFISSLTADNHLDPPGRFFADEVAERKLEKVTVSPHHLVRLMRLHKVASNSMGTAFATKEFESHSFDLMSELNYGLTILI